MPFCCYYFTDAIVIVRDLILLMFLIKSTFAHYLINNLREPINSFYSYHQTFVKNQFCQIRVLVASYLVSEIFE